MLSELQILTEDHDLSRVDWKSSVRLLIKYPVQHLVERCCTVVEELYVETKEEEILCLFILVNDSENMDEDFSIHQRSTRPKKKPSKPKKSTNKSKDIKIKKETL